MLSGVKSAGGNRRSVGCVIASHAVRAPVADPLSSAGIASLIATAEQLRRPAAARPLRGKNLALLRPDASAGPSSLQHAAEEIGARVAMLEFPRSARTREADDEIGTLARLLGRMYDGIDCADLHASIRRLIESHAGVPVFPGLELDTHPARAIADLWTLCEHQGPGDRRIVFIGNGRRPRARMFMAAARAMGVAILTKTRAEGGGERMPAVADASGPGRWVLWVGDVAVDDEAAQDNHRRIMQAVLIDALRRA